MNMELKQNRTIISEKSQKININIFIITKIRRFQYFTSQKIYAKIIIYTKNKRSSAKSTGALKPINNIATQGEI